MKRSLSVHLIWIGLIFSGIVAFAVHQGVFNMVYPVNNRPDYLNERLQYNIAFGVFNIGVGTLRVDEKFYTVQSKPCYKVTAHGKTSGLISWIARINDRFGAYVDTTELLPQLSSRKLREGNFRMDEIATFDHNNNRVKRKEKDQKTGKFKPAKLYTIPNNSRDLLSGFLYIRTLDFEKMNRGDTIAFPAFLEDTSYDFKTLNMGVEKVETRLGWIRCIKLVPIMPKNKLFVGEKPISCWISADANRIPIKVQAKMFIGNFKVEITSYKSPRNRLNF